MLWITGAFLENKFKYIHACSTTRYTGTDLFSSEQTNHYFQFPLLHKKKKIKLVKHTNFISNFYFQLFVFRDFLTSKIVNDPTYV